MVFGLVFYFALQHAPVVNTLGFSTIKLSRVSKQSSPPISIVNQEKCACCRETLAQSRKVAEQRIQARKAWAREMFANYGYEEGVKRILAKQIQQTLEREKQPNLAVAITQSFT